MTRLLIRIKTLSPLYAGAFKPYGLFLETHGEISGALLRGAVAGKTLASCAAPEFLNNHEKCDVKDLCPFYYLTAGVVFPTCANADITHRTEPSLRTMVTCKAAPGFKTERDRKPSEQGHGVFDTLLRHLVFNELRRNGIRQLPPLRCQTCNAPLEPFSKRYVNEGNGRYHAVPSPRTRRMTHVGINRRRETAEQGFLYSVEVIVEGTQFVGQLTLPDSWDESRVVEFKKLLESITRLGGEQTYGLGRVEIEVNETDGDEEDVQTRVTAFNEKLKEVWRKYSKSEVPQGDSFTIDLLTPTLLTTPDGTPTVQLTAEMLKKRAAELGFSGLPAIEQIGYPDDAGRRHPLMFSGPTMVAGWSEAWGLPKPPSLAALAGSVYVFHTRDICAWYDALTEIERNGIGARSEEGFGAVRVCDPYHREVDPK